MSCLSKYSSTFLLSMLWLFFLPFSGIAKKTNLHGYDIKVTFKQPIEDETIALAKYFGKGYPQVYKVAETEVNNQTIAHFKSEDSILGGYYLILFKNNEYFFELILDDGDQFEIIVDTTAFPKNIQYKNSSQNTDYVKYVNKVSEISTRHQALVEQLEEQQTSADSTIIQRELQALSEEINDFRKQYIAQNPDGFLAQIFKALLPVEVPEGPHYLEDGVTLDSTFAYRYYKNHFWDGFNFKEERLIHAPVFDHKLEEYFNKVVAPYPDSIIAAADRLLALPDQDKELFKYGLHFITRFAESSKIMGMDEVFVYMVENYHMQGKAYWMDEELLEKFANRARQIAPNVIGRTAFNLSVNDAFTLKEQRLHDFDSDETVLIFWTPTCSACLREVPKLKKLYDEELKARGIKVFSVVLGGDLEMIQKQIIESDIEEWNNFVVTKNIHEIQENFDTYDTPKLYYLGKDFVIEGKRLSSDSMLEFLEVYDKRKQL